MCTTVMNKCSCLLGCQSSGEADKHVKRARVHVSWQAGLHLGGQGDSNLLLEITTYIVLVFNSWFHRDQCMVFALFWAIFQQLGKHSKSVFYLL